MTNILNKYIKLCDLYHKNRDEELYKKISNITFKNTRVFKNTQLSFSKYITIYLKYVDISTLITGQDCTNFINNLNKDAPFITHLIVTNCQLEEFFIDMPNLIYLNLMNNPIHTDLTNSFSTNTIKLQEIDIPDNISNIKLPLFVILSYKIYPCVNMISNLSDNIIIQHMSYMTFNNKICKIGYNNYGSYNNEKLISLRDICLYNIPQYYIRAENRYQYDNMLSKKDIVLSCSRCMSIFKEAYLYISIIIINELYVAKHIYYEGYICNDCLDSYNF